MKKPNIHTPSEERLAFNTVSAIDYNTKEVVKNTRAVEALHSSVKDKSVEMAGLVGVIKNVQKGSEATESLKNYIDNPKKVVQKMEEVKSALLISNKHLKDISKKELPLYPEMPKTDLGGVEKLLGEVLKELKKPEEIVIKLELE